MSAKTVLIGESPNEVLVGGASPVVLIAGPCVLENWEMTYRICSELIDYTNRYKMPFIFKGSYEKANRTALNSYTGIGIEEGLEILNRVHEDLDVPVLTDVHREEDVVDVATVVDVLQIPAFLCRQTKLIIVAGRTGLPVNIKKGQWMAAEDMWHAATKTGHYKVMLTERGNSFGYHDLIVDFRNLARLSRIGLPVVFDITHSLQLPSGSGSSSGGLSEFVLPMARAGVAFGVDAVYMEVYPDPKKAKCDGPNSLALGDVPEVLRQIKLIEDVLGSSL